MFSIIIPLYNKSHYISRAINSALNQTFKEFEIIVINDGSSDGGEKLVEKKYSNRVQLFHQQNQGVSAARNNGIKKAKYEWIAFLDADDYWHPDYLKSVNQVIFENPEIGIIGTHYNSSVLEKKPKLQYFFLENYFRKAVENTRFFTSATVLRKEFFENNSGFDPQIRLGEDIDVWLRASLYFGDGIYINNTLVYYGQEDKGRATNQVYELSQTLIPKLCQEGYYENSHKESFCSLEEFLEFRDKWLYFTLFPHFVLKSNKEPIYHVMHSMASNYFLIRGFYLLPYGLLNRLFSNRYFSGQFRNYMKFCFRYIYT